jgi:hypothetical protein
MVRLGKAAVAAAVLTSVGALAGAASANTGFGERARDAGEILFPGGPWGDQ